MNHDKTRVILAIAAAFALGLVLVAGGGALAKGKPPIEQTNNLSYPAIYTESLVEVFEWTPPENGGEMGTHFSYGCDQPQTIGNFSYPNTTCAELNDEGVAVAYLSPEACTAMDGPCAGLPVERIYWQKVPDNVWNADSLFYDPLYPVTANYLDWGDNLESNTWSTRSTIRVETQPFQDTGLELQGFEMWHYSGHGPTEAWGVRTTDAVEPYVYISPYAIIHTNKARLNMSKLVAAADTCPTPGTGEVGEPPVLNLDWVEDLNAQGEMSWINNDPEGVDPCKLRDIDYTVELNVGGKFVYGYNWASKRDFLSCDGFDKAGWWRLTFYTEPDNVGDSPVYFDALNPVAEPYGPPVLPDGAPMAAEPESETEESLYSAEIDYEHNLTYIDICLKPKGGGKTRVIRDVTWPSDQDGGQSSQVAQ